MKTSSRSSTRREYKFSQKVIDRAVEYAATAIYNSPLLRKHYSTLAKFLKLRGPLEAAFHDYLRHEKEFRELNKEL